MNTTTPSWDDFCAKMAKCAPALTPERDDKRWKELYGVFALGYESALEKVLVMLEEEKRRHDHHA